MNYNEPHENGTLNSSVFCCSNILKVLAGIMQFIYKQIKIESCIKEKICLNKVIMRGIKTKHTSKRGKTAAAVTNDRPVDKKNVITACDKTIVFDHIAHGSSIGRK